MGWWVVWPQSGVAVQSPELLQLTGMDPARERELSEAIRDQGRRAIAAGEPLDFRHHVRQPDGTVQTLRVRGDVVSRGGEGTALQGFAQDISELARATTQQQVVAELDRVALGDAPVQELIEQVTGAAARTLGVRRVAVFALDPAGRELALRGLAPTMEEEFPQVLPAGEGSFGGYTLRLRRPVVVEDWQAETRFSPADRALGGSAQRRLRGGRRRGGALRRADGGRRPSGPLRRGGHRLPAEPRQRARRGHRPAAGGGGDRRAGGRARPPGGAGARRRGAGAAVDVREPARRRAAGHPGRRPRPVGARRRPGSRRRPRDAARRRRAPARGDGRPPPHRARLRRARRRAARGRRPAVGGRRVRGRGRRGRRPRSAGATSWCCPSRASS